MFDVYKHPIGLLVYSNHSALPGPLCQGQGAHPAQESSVAKAKGTWGLIWSDKSQLVGLETNATKIFKWRNQRSYDHQWRQGVLLGSTAPCHKGATSGWLISNGFQLSNCSSHEIVGTSCAPGNAEARLFSPADESSRSLSR